VASSHTASLLASGGTAINALDGGYRLAFTVALMSVVVGFVLGTVILKTPDPAHERREDDRSDDAISETMVAEVL